MPHYKPQERNSLMLPVVLSEQIEPGSFAFALEYLVDHELDFSTLDARFNNDETGASAYDPRIMLKIVLLAYSQGIVSSRGIERACQRNVQFIAISGDSQPSHAHIAKFVSTLGAEVKALFAQVLMTCDAQGLIAGDMFAIDGVKLPGNASKERSGTHAELLYRARRLGKAADKIVRLNRKGQELKTNVTDPDSAKMATGKGVIQGYAAQATVDSAHQVIVAAGISTSGSEQAMLLPMVEQASAYRKKHTLITADAGYHSQANLNRLKEQGIPALVADNQMRQRDERFKERDRYKAKDPLAEKKPTGQDKPVKRFGPKDFDFHGDNTCTCPAGQTLTSFGTWYTTARGLRYQLYDARDKDCQACSLRMQCLKSPQNGRARQVTRFQPKADDPHDPIERMKRAIDSARGRHLYSQRIGTVEPVFANIRHNKGLNRLHLRGREKVNTQWQLYCMVHNIEKLANSGWRQ